MAGGFYIASLLIKDGTSDFKSSSAVPLGSYGWEKFLGVEVVSGGWDTG